MNIHDAVMKWMPFADIGNSSRLTRQRIHTSGDGPRQSTLSGKQLAKRKVRQRMARMSRRANRHSKVRVHGQSKRR